MTDRAGGDTKNGPQVDVAKRCLSIDLEVGVQDQRIDQFAAVRGDSGLAFVHRGGTKLADALAKLDAFAHGSEFLLGHNIVAFDVPFLAAAKADLRLLNLPVLDTLRLNPLAFPRNPYHHLVKHYQEGQLKRGRLNDPDLDARLTLALLNDQLIALRAMAENKPDLLSAWHWLTCTDDAAAAVDAFFAQVRGQARPDDVQATAAIGHCLAGQACETQGAAILAHPGRDGWALAYALAWLSVAGGNSVMPPWVRHQFPEAGLLVRRLRDQACGVPSCRWCGDRHDAHRELARWFRLDGFRPEPRGVDGRPLQQAIVEAAMRGEHVLGILPTGTGKSLCYQIPALSRYDKTGGLTVVISPLVALMADQVVGLEARGIACSAALNGLLSMPERADVLDRVRLGDVGILIISPEQLRSRALRGALAQREIAAWVLDEAHCLSKWGHDFRPDYRYVGRFIREKAGESAVPPVLCLTATAKPEVVADIVGYFRDRLGLTLTLFDGGANRTNLDFEVVPTNAAAKFDHTHQVLMADLPDATPGGAIVYCSSRVRTEELAAFLRDKGLAAGHFHAGLAPQSKKDTQQRFINGELRVMVATNAFGMGIDKPDVRLVIHADVPGSLENYLQEAGRAGRDSAAARCVLLYAHDDVERQFSLSARSRLTQREIQAILKSLRNLDRRKRLGGAVIATAGEILMDEHDGAFQRDSVTDDTRVRTAIAWLEESKLLAREENVVQIFPSSLRVGSIADAGARLERAPMQPGYRAKLLAIVDALLAARADEGISTDELMLVARLNAQDIRRAMFDLEKLGIASNDMALTAFVRAGVERSSARRLEQAQALEAALIDELRLAAPDLAPGEPSLLHLRHATQRLKDAGHDQALPETLWRTVRSLAADGRSESGGTPSLRLRRLDPETVELRLQRNWQAIDQTARLRRAAAGRLLEHLLAVLPGGARGVDMLAHTTLGKLLFAIEGDMVLMADVKDANKLLDHALLWLHEQEVIRLNKGLAVFRPAMTIRLETGERKFERSDFTPLQLHYDELVLQIHVMAEYAQRGLRTMTEALRLTMDYFTLQRDEFMQRWMPERDKELSRQTTPQSWRAIVESLANPVQQRIVADDRDTTNVLVLAGPGSGKTRVLVHRIAYLVRARRENPKGILALAYNRHAAVQIRRRLRELIGDDANGVTVLTCHALAMRLAGVSFVSVASPTDDDVFGQALQQAIDLLEGKGLPPDEADEQRERLLAGFRWILVDEYQDIGPGQYRLISALAGRTLRDDEGKLSLFAVGDDDQNIYAFNGASVEFIRHFETDYVARIAFLTENYRSTAHIVEAANLLIAPARERIKAQHPITVDRVRRKQPPGGRWQRLDPFGQGRVQLLPLARTPIDQALMAVGELRRLAALDADWDWARTAVIARTWRTLDPVRAYCELLRLPVQVADEEMPPVWRLRETQALVRWLRLEAGPLTDAAALRRRVSVQGGGTWWSLLSDAVDEYGIETADAELPVAHFLDWLAEWAREARRRQTGLLLLSAHRAKGLEFDHVVVLDGGWNQRDSAEDPDAKRRLYYVSMTRARETLALTRCGTGTHMSDALLQSTGVQRRMDEVQGEPPPAALSRLYRRPTLSEVDIGYAGRYAATSSLHAAIAALRIGDPLDLRRTSDRWELADRAGQTVGRLARAFQPPATCIHASVAAIIVRRREDTDPDYLSSVRCDEWEIVLPDLVFETDR